MRRPVVAAAVLLVAALALAGLAGVAGVAGVAGPASAESAERPGRPPLVAVASAVEAAAGDDGPFCVASPAPPPGSPQPPPPPPLPPLQLAPGQPGEPAPAGEVPFNHKAHAGDCKMPCLSCHVYADRSPVAGLPSGRKCMGCHKFVAKERPAVRALAARYKAGQPLQWERVFAVPDFIYFSHRVHLHAKEPLDCKECHGDVAAMKVVRQERPFTMGRCLECHEKRHATRDCLACHK